MLAVFDGARWQARLDRLAVTAASHLRGSVAGLPRWIARIGAVTPTRAWVASDVFGDQESLIVGFAQEGAPGEHALVVLVDRNLSGQAKDAWIGPDLEGIAASVDRPNHTNDGAVVRKAEAPSRDGGGVPADRLRLATTQSPDPSHPALLHADQ